MSDTLLLIHLLLLLLVANGTPVVARIILGRRLDRPLDGGIKLSDGKPLLGPSKTLRGLAASILATIVMAWLLGYPPTLGAGFALFAMLGDLGSSFIKRRMGMTSSRNALGLDQIPEALFPLLFVRHELSLAWTDIFILTLAFLVLDLVLGSLLAQTRPRFRSG